MGLGNGNSKHGDKGSNFKYELKHLQGLEDIISTLTTISNTLSLDQDYEAKLVVDDNGNGSTYLEVRIYNPDTQTWETPLYYLPGSNTGVPAGSLTAPILYINPNTYLATIATNTSAGSRTHNTVVATGVGSVPLGSIRGSVLNNGAAAGTWNGISIPAGVVIPWDEVGNRDTYGAINYDATGTTFIIEYTT